MPEQVPTTETIRIIREIQKTSFVTQRNLSEKLGISLGKTNYIVKALVEKGIIRLKRFKNSHKKISYLYLLTPTGIKKKALITKRFLNYKLGEYEKLKQEIKELKSELV